MSRDIYLSHDGELRTADTDVYKAENILMVQLGALYYEQDFGIDLTRFIDPGVEIQLETFRAYTVDRLIANGVQVYTVQTVVDKFMAKINYTISEPAEAKDVF